MQPILCMEIVVYYRPCKLKLRFDLMLCSMNFHVDEEKMVSPVEICSFLFVHPNDCSFVSEI